MKFDHNKKQIYLNELKPQFHQFSVASQPNTPHTRNKIEEQQKFESIVLKNMF